MNDSILDLALPRVAILFAAASAISCGGGGGGGGGGGTAPEPDATSPASVCYDLSPAKGKTIERSQSITFYNLDGSVRSRGGDTQTAVVGDLADFEGNRAVETSTTGNSTNANGDVTVTYTGKDYSRQTGPLEFTEYGGTVQASTRDGAGETKLVYAPPFVNQAPAMTAGQELAYTTTSIFTTSVNGVAQPPIESTETHTVRYVGVESLTIAAGTFNACKFELFDSPAGPTDTLWYLVGHGIELKYLQPATPGIVGEFVRELTSILIDGSKP